MGFCERILTAPKRDRPEIRERRDEFARIFAEHCLGVGHELFGE